MIVGLLTGLLIAGVCIPVANLLGKGIRSPWAFLAAYLPLGLMVVIIGYFIISLIIVPSLQIYGLVSILSCASIGSAKFKELKFSQRAAQAAQKEWHH